MAIFASRRVNVDPEPWVNPAGDLRYHTQVHGGWKFDPRPEFDNVVNPILVAFRVVYDREAAGFLAGAEMREIEKGKWSAVASREHIDHARRVLQKLAAFRG